jgi:Domain of unknown function (DUF5671)
MKPAEQVAEFVGRALAAGQRREDIAWALQAAGWQPTEVARGLNAWADAPFNPPVPRPRSTVSAREAFIYGLLFSFLLCAVIFINRLGFALVDKALGGFVENYAREWATATIRWSIAMLVVTVPAFLWLNHRQVIAMAADPSKRRSAMRKWFGYTTLFVAALTLAGDLVYTIYALLQGDLTLQFALKAGLLLVTTGLVFLYFRLETEDTDAP